MNKFIISWFKCTILLLRRVLFAQPFSTSGGWRRRGRWQQRLRGSFGNVKNEVEWCRRYTFVQKSGAPALQRRPGRLAPLYFVLPCVLRTRARQCFVRHGTVPPHALCSSRKVRRTQRRTPRGAHHRTPAARLSTCRRRSPRRHANRAVHKTSVSQKCTHRVSPK